MRDTEISHLQMAEEKLDMIKDDYEQKKNRKWKMLLFGSVLGLLLGYIVPLVATKLNNSLYKRTNVDKIMQEYLGYGQFGKLLTNETVIVAYEYNSQEPRFYSDYFRHKNPLIFDVKVGNATGASSAAPAYFDPKVNRNGYGMNEILIDGGIICNNPSMYAYQMAYYFWGRRNIRVLSLGTGEKKFEKIDASTMDMLSYLSK